MSVCVAVSAEPPTSHVTFTELVGAKAPSVQARLVAGLGGLVSISIAGEHDESVKSPALSMVLI